MVCYRVLQRLIANQRRKVSEQGTAARVFNKLRMTSSY